LESKKEIRKLESFVWAATIVSAVSKITKIS